MAIITQTIGTNSRDFATITSWESQLDDTGVFSATDEAIGEAYADSAFDEAVTIDGGGTVGLSSVKLTVAVGERHDGTAGTGVRIAKSAHSNVSVIDIDIINTTVEWMEIDGSSGGANVVRGILMGTNFGTNSSISKCIVHHMSSNSNVARGITVISGQAGKCFDCIVYSIESSGGTGRNVEGIFVGTGSFSDQCYNCTVYDTKKTGGTGDTSGFKGNSDADTVIQNCVSVGNSNDVSGTLLDFNAPAGESYCASSDATAVGTGSIDSIVTADQFVSIVGGSEDLHLKAGSDCIGAGLDLGTTPSGVQIDIDGRDRDAEGDVWDIGADQFVASAGGDIKTINGIAIASVKTWNGIAIASIKTLNGISNV